MKKPQRAKPKPEAPKPEPVNVAAEADDAARIREAHKIDEAREQGIHEGMVIGKSQERHKLLDAICARIAFYEASHMKPVAMMLSWHEALVILEVLQDAGHGFAEQRALATQQQWRVVHDGDEMVASRGP